MFEWLGVLVGIGFLLVMIVRLFDRSTGSKSPPRPLYRPAIQSRPTLPTVPPVRKGYGRDWKKLSRLVRERDNWTCCVCGWQAVGRDRYFIHAHHIVARGRGGSDTPDNLISLCLECHADQPGHRRMRYSPDYQQFMEKRYG